MLFSLIISGDMSRFESELISENVPCHLFHKDLRGSMYVRIAYKVCFSMLVGLNKSARVFLGHIHKNTLSSTHFGLCMKLSWFAVIF